MCLFASGCLFHDCLTGCLSVVTLVSVCDRVEITTKYEYCRLYSTVKFPRVWRPEARVFPTDVVSKQRTRCVLLRLCGLFAATDRENATPPAAARAWLTAENAQREAE